MNEAVSVDSATKIVDRIPRPGMEEPLESAIHELTQAAMRFPGHLGVTVMRPSPPSQPGFRLVYKFDSSEHMRAWEDSAEQHRLVENANRYTQGEPRYHRLSGLEAWFTLPGAAPSMPPKGKMTFVSWVGIFPLVYIFGLAVSGVLPKGTPGVIRVLVVTALVVPTMSYVVGPWLTRVLKAWLFRSAKPN